VLSQFVRCSGWLGSRVVSVLDSGTEGPGFPVFKSQLRRCRVTVLGKLFTPIVPLFTNSETLYDTRCYFNVRSKADISQLNLP